MVTSDYYFLDASFFPGINYYRLTQTDFNGIHSYSEILTIERTTIVFEWMIYYNQWDATLNVELFSPMQEAVTISILNNNGQTLMEAEKMISAGYNEMKVALPFSTNTLCFVILNIPGKDRSVQKILLW